MRVDFEQQRMAQAAVDHVRLADPGAEAVQAGLDLGNHAFVNDAAGDQLPTAGGIQAADEGTLVAAVHEDAGRVGEEHQFFSAQLPGHGGGGRVGVDVEPAAVGVKRQRGDDGNDAGGTKGLNQVSVDAAHAADPAEIDRLPALPRQEQAFAEQALQRAGVQGHSPAAEPADLGHDPGVDLFEQDADDDGQGLVVGVTAAEDLARL